MSFQPKSFWQPRDAGCLAGENMGYENSSRIEPKRSHQCFMNTGEPEIFSNKKPAVDGVGGRPFSGMSHVNVPPWDTNSGFHSVTGHFSDRLFGSDLVRSDNLIDKNMPPFGSGNLNVEGKEFENQYVNDPSVGLSISHNIADPSSCFNFGGIRKVKVNQVRDSDSCFPASLGNSYSRADNSTMSMGASYDKNDGNISLGSAYNNGNVNTFAMGNGISKTDANLVSMGHTFNKVDGSFLPMGHSYDKVDECILSMNQPFNRGNFISMGQSYEKGDSNLIPLGTSYTKGNENFISMGLAYSKAGENLINIAPSYDKATDHILSIGPTYKQADSNIASINPSYDRGDSSSLPVGHNYNKGEGSCSIISFGAFDENTEPNPSDGIINGYNLVMGNQNLAQDVDSQKDLTNSNPEPPVNSTPNPNTKDTAQKNKEPKKPKKAATNNFPSNVKSLLSTGIFDGVPVKYVSWSREKNLAAIIKGTGYVCSCEDCNQSKALNAYEFERHAGAKTKHPNNHIYFENGKTVYAVVQELKSTPQDMLFDAIQNVTGSAINQKNFRIWKASYQAATKELQRIYGTDEVVAPA